MSISDQHLICHINNMFISSHAWAALWWSKRAKYWSLLHSASQCKHGEQRRGCFSFFWVQVDVIGIPPAAFYFTWWALGPMYWRNGRRRGIPPGVQRSSFICRLPSCLLQIFRKVSRFWHESKNHFCRVSSSPLEIAHHSSKAAALAAPEWGGQSRGHKSRLNVVFRKPPGLCRPCWAFKLWSRNIYYQLRLLLIDISAILHLKRSSIFTGTPSFTARLRREFKLNHAAPSCLSVMSWNEAPVHSEKLRISPLPEGDINLFSAEHKHMFRVHANVLSSCIASG